MTPRSEILTHEQAREALDILAKWFEVPRPDLMWSTRSKRGYAYYFRNTIKIGPKCWRGTTDSLLHEFAHLLAIRRAKQLIGDGRAGRGHRAPFHQALHMVVAAWYGDPSRYGWQTEYPNVRAYARREGIYKPEPSMLPEVMVELSMNPNPLAQAAGPKERE